MGTYVVGDIHGCYDEWIELKNKIENQDSNAKFIIIGDVVDRGPKVLEMIDWAMENITPDGKYQMILGNHEDLKINWAKQYNSLGKVGNNKQIYKYFSIERYGFKELLLENNKSDKYVAEIIEFFKSLPLYLELDIKTKFETTQSYIICHAGFPNDYIESNGKINKKDFDNPDLYKHIRHHMLWERNYWGNYWKGNAILIHGHTPTMSSDLTKRGSVPGKIDFKHKDINIDCGIVFSGEPTCNLAAIRLEDLEEFYLYNKDFKGALYKESQLATKNDMLHLLEYGDLECI